MVEVKKTTVSTDKDLFAPIDVGIITIIPNVELSALLRTFNIDKTTEPMQIGDGSYWFTNVKSGDFTLRIAITASGKQGNENAKTVTRNLISNFQPKNVLLVGIAAGVKGKVTMGDVVIADSIIYYEPSKMSLEGREPRYQMMNTSEDLLEKVRLFASQAIDCGWHKIFYMAQAMLDPNEDPPKLLRPKSYIGSIASGEKIFADGSLEKMQQSLHGNIRAGETEGWGFARAAHEAKVPWLVIRGISDLGDTETKDGVMKDQYHPSAANAAATYAKTFMESSYFPLFKKSADSQKELPKPSQGGISPWTLFGKPIELSSLSEGEFWTKISDDSTKTLKMRIILPSGKFEGSNKMLPLVSDSMFLPEVMVCIADIIKEAGIRMDVQTLFDIDVVYQKVGKFEFKEDTLSDCNLILTATGDINLATRLLFQHELLFNLKPGPTGPDSSCINGLRDNYPEVYNPDLGLLSIFRSPFNKKRIVIFAAGTLAIGTLGALKLLHLFVTGKAKNLGNNNNDRNIAAKIVNFCRKQYPLPLLDAGVTIPRMELRNIDIERLIVGHEVRE